MYILVGRRRAADISCGYGGEEKTVGWVAVACGAEHRPRMVGRSSVSQSTRIPSSPSLLHAGALHLGSEGTGQQGTVLGP